MSAPDERDIRHGRLIPALRYCDQVYVVKADDGAWVAIMTTGHGTEGDRGQHVAVVRSTDQGMSWSAPLVLEPPDGPEASYAVLLKTPFGRIYAFYNHNTDRVTEVLRQDGKSFLRVDSLGHYVFRYSDDHGRTWSARRHEVPLRIFASDRANPYHGQLLLFWNVGRPCVAGDAVYIPHTKVSAMGEGFYAASEGTFLRSPNLLDEADPDKVRFETLPEGDIGLRTPPGGGPISEEQSLVELSDGSLYCVYRSIDGWPVCSYSRDGGRSWDPPTYQCYHPGGRRMKHPRAANFVWKCRNGKFLYWYHNQGGGPSARQGWDPYSGRNPVWLSCGTEVDSPEGRKLIWSQPEILLYDDDPLVRISYPDLIEDDGRFFVTETQKATARVHPMDDTFLRDLFKQRTANRPAADPVFDSEGEAIDGARAPKLPSLCYADPTYEHRPSAFTRRGFSLELILGAATAPGNTTLVSTLLPGGRGFRVSLTADDRLEFFFSDGRFSSLFTSTLTLSANLCHHATLIVDGGPRVVLFLLDGILDDGGDERQYGWVAVPPHLSHANGAETLSVPSDRLQRLRLFDRPLRISEAVANARANRPPSPDQ